MDPCAIKRPKSCSRVRSGGPLREKKAGIVLKGAPRWTLARNNGRNRAQGCAQMDPCARKRPESCSRVRPDGPLREKTGEIVLKGPTACTLALVEAVDQAVYLFWRET